MRPDTSNNTSNMKPQYSDKEGLMNARKSLHVLQPAAGDKENLVGPGRSLQTSGKDALKNMRDQTEIKNLINEKRNEENASSKSSAKRKKKTSKLIQTDTPKATISMDDLTSEAGPSENYWEALAERRRLALEEALRENESLHKRIEILKKEKAVTQEMLDEARHLVDVLTEIIDGINSDDQGEQEAIEERQDA